jgi:5-methylcytosine-specific restriction endonuclease McrA
MSNKNGSKWIRPEKRLAIYSRDGFCCVYCRAEDKLSLDHLQPRELGGSHEATNLVTCCVSCNSARKDQAMRVWLKVLRDDGVDVNGLARRIRSLASKSLDMGEGKRLLAARVK